MVTIFNLYICTNYLQLIQNELINLVYVRAQLLVLRVLNLFCVCIGFQIQIYLLFLKYNCVAYRVGKVSGIEVSGRVSGMPEMPGTKPGFGHPKLPETINLKI